MIPLQAGVEKCDCKEAGGEQDEGSNFGRGMGLVGDASPMMPAWISSHLPRVEMELG